MPAIQSGFVTALYLFDVADRIDLDAVRRRLGGQAETARLADKTAGPPRLRYIQAPVLVDGEAFGCADLDGFRVRVKFYDYGVISLMLSQPFAGSWNDLVSLGQSLIENDPLEQHAADACARVAAEVATALTEPRPAFLDEDYLVFAVTALDEPATADLVLSRHGAAIAQLLRGERQPLSGQEEDLVLRNQLSYLADDLVIPAWNAAFIYDTEAAARAAIEILEFANSQLLEFRYHDDALETELTRTYAELSAPRRRRWFGGRRYTKAARHLQAVVIDVNELTDRMENSVKFVGDIYAARLFGNVAARLGLDRWKRNVDEKLKTLDDIYRFAVESTSMSQANILELAILLILVLELGLFFAGIMQ
jgi:hypothetical protein